MSVSETRSTGITAALDCLRSHRLYIPSTIAGLMLGFSFMVLVRVRLTLILTPTVAFVTRQLHQFKPLRGCVRHLQHLASHHLHTHVNKHLQIAPQHLLALHIMQHDSIPQLTTSLPNSPTSINNSFSSHDISTSPTNNRLVSQPTTTVQRQGHKPLKIININFQSIKNKTAELGNFISVSDPDILIGTETWLNQTIADNEIFPPGYSLLRKDRQDGYGGGGVLLAIKSDIIHEPIFSDTNTIRNDCH